MKHIRTYCLWAVICNRLTNTAAAARVRQSSWRAPIPAADENVGDMMDYRRGNQWRLRGLCSTDQVLDMFPRRLRPWFEQLLGAGAVVEPQVKWANGSNCPAVGTRWA